MVGLSNLFAPQLRSHVRGRRADAPSPARHCGPGVHRLHGGARILIGGWPHYLHSDRRGVALWRETSQGWGLGVVVRADGGWARTAEGVLVRLTACAGSAGPGVSYELEVAARADEDGEG